MAEDKYPKFRKKKFIPKILLNEREVAFFDKLKKGLKGLHVFPQVSMNAVLDVEQQRTWKDRMEFWAKIIDFVVCTPEYQIIAMVELDGPSHDNPETQAKDAERDTMLKDAGYIVVRYDWRNEPSARQLNQSFKGIIMEWNRLKLAEKLAKHLHELDE